MGATARQSRLVIQNRINVFLSLHFGNNLEIRFPHFCNSVDLVKPMVILLFFRIIVKNCCSSLKTIAVNFKRVIVDV